MLAHTCVEGCFSVVLVPEPDATGTHVGCRQEQRAMEAIKGSFLQKQPPLASLRPSGCWNGQGTTLRACSPPQPPMQVVFFLLHQPRPHRRWRSPLRSPPFFNLSPGFGSVGVSSWGRTWCGLSTLRGAERGSCETLWRGEGSSPGAKRSLQAVHVSSVYAPLFACKQKQQLICKAAFCKRAF